MQTLPFKNDSITKAHSDSLIVIINKLAASNSELTYKFDKIQESLEDRENTGMLGLINQKNELGQDITVILVFVIMFVTVTSTILTMITRRRKTQEITDELKAKIEEVEQEIKKEAYPKQQETNQETRPELTEGTSFSVPKVTSVIKTLKGWKKSNPSLYWEKVQGFFKKETVLETLKDKAQRADTLAKVSLWSIVILVISAMVFFFYAGDIANIENSYPSNLKTNIDDVLKDPRISGNNKLQFEDQLRLAEKYLVVTQQSNLNNQVLKLIASSSLRIGIVLMLFFLANVFLKIYRYSLKMADFYNARIAALIVTGGDANQTEYKGLVDVFTANVDFGIAPKSPVKEIVTAVNTAIASKLPYLPKATRTARKKKPLSDTND